MIINRNNQNIIDTGEICFHDLFITSFVFNPQEKEIGIIVSDSHSDLFCVKLINVFDFLYTNRYPYKVKVNNMIYGWEEIPNEYTKDYFLEDVRNSFINSGGKWNDEIFAVRFLLVNMSEIKIICEEIYIDIMTTN